MHTHLCHSHHLALAHVCTPITTTHTHTHRWAAMTTERRTSPCILVPLARTLDGQRAKARVTTTPSTQRVLVQFMTTPSSRKGIHFDFQFVKKYKISVRC